MAPQARFPCPCCGYVVFPEEPGSYDICPICFWEDDIVQLRFPKAGGGPNGVSLLDAQRNFAEFGACEASASPHVRPAGPSDLRDPGWRPLDSEEVEELVRGEAYGRTYPDDSTWLYYWRPTYWRRGAQA